MDLGQLQVQERLFCDTFLYSFSCHLVDYRWECIFRETPKEATRNANSSFTVFLSASFCWPLSTLQF